MTVSGPAYLADAYRDKELSYYAGARADYVERLPASGTARVLELGCGDGATGALALRAGRAREYVGIEMFASVAEEAAKVLTRVHVGDVAQLDLPYAPATFDALIMSEVVEHLVDPEAVLRKLVPLVRPGGLVMASSPNIGHWRIVRDLMMGRFDYTASGPMDRTHLRWFTPRSYCLLFEAAGVEIDSVGPVGTPGLRSKIAGRVLGPLHQLRFYQINLIGRRRAA